MPRGALTGSRIRDRRVAAGMKQADLARAAGISASYLNLIEHNRRRIGGKLVADIAGALDCEVSVLTEGAEAMLLAALREAAAGGTDPGEEKAEEFAGRFPGWARLLAERHARVGQLEREVGALTDRLSHDPQLSAALHELLTAVTAIRSSTGILTGTEGLDAVWVARFLGIVDAEGRRLAEGAEALVRYLEGAGAAEPSATTPQEEVEAMLAARGWHLPELEGDARAEQVEALVAGAAELTGAAARALARVAAERYRQDARAMPLPRLAAVAEDGPGAVMAAFGVQALAALRRLAFLPGREAGLVIADAAGAISLRRPIAGFVLPRQGAACPLWPLFLALTRPGVPVSALVEMPGAAARRFRAEAVAAPRAQPDFAAPPVIEAVMLLTPAAPAERAGPAQQVGPTCRLCAREACPARREPSILGLGLGLVPGAGR